MGHKKILYLLPLVLCCALLLPHTAFAQPKVIVNMAAVDGIDLTPDNILNLHIQSLDNKSMQVMVKGSLRYRNSAMSMNYSFRYTLQPGMNVLSSAAVHPQWQFSSQVLQELFTIHRLLPAGTVEYCVTADPVNSANEVQNGGGDECIYHTTDETFFINLLMPEDKAKLYEYYPSFSWIANYSLSAELTYRLRVAEIKKGQNAASAVVRNQPVYDEKNLSFNSKMYPVYAKPLVKDQPYAWTVDAYYKGILLGSAEAWQFIILEDSVIKGPPISRSYIDIRKENGASKLYAEGELKIKYVLDKTKTDTLDIALVDEGNNRIPLKPARLPAVYGDNRYTITLKDNTPVKHKHMYKLIVMTKYKEQFIVPFEYLNADFLH